jgi:hypothetical protein
MTKDVISKSALLQGLCVLLLLAVGHSSVPRAYAPPIKCDNCTCADMSAWKSGSIKPSRMWAVKSGQPDLSYANAVSLSVLASPCSLQTNLTAAVPPTGYTFQVKLCTANDVCNNGGLGGIEQVDPTSVGTSPVTATDYFCGP